MNLDETRQIILCEFYCGAFSYRNDVIQFHMRRHGTMEHTCPSKILVELESLKLKHPEARRKLPLEFSYMDLVDESLFGITVGIAYVQAGIWRMQSQLSDWALGEWSDEKVVEYLKKNTRWERVKCSSV